MTIGMFILGTAVIAGLMFVVAYLDFKVFGARGMNGWMSSRLFGQEK